MRGKEAVETALGLQHSGEDPDPAARMRNHALDEGGCRLKSVIWPLREELFDSLFALLWFEAANGVNKASAGSNPLRGPGQ